MGVLPILPLLFPVMWVLLNAFGEARVLAEFSRASPAGLVRSTHTHRHTQTNAHTQLYLCNVLYQTALVTNMDTTHCRVRLLVCFESAVKVNTDSPPACEMLTV